jgi:peroxiredoxin
LTSTSLTPPINAARTRIRGSIGDVLDDLDRSAEAFGAGTYSAPRVGEVAPDFTLPDANGTQVSLAELRGRNRVVLGFYRGSWCPYCDVQLRAFQASLDELEAAGAEPVAVSPLMPEESRSMAEERGLTFKLLSDAGNAVAESYGLRVTLDGEHRDSHVGVGVDLPAKNGDDSWSLPVPSTFVIEPDGTVSHAWVPGDPRVRVGPEEVLEALTA